MDVVDLEREVAEIARFAIILGIPVVGEFQKRRIAAHIGPVLSYEYLLSQVSKLPKTEQNRAAALLVEKAVRKLAPKAPVDRP